MARRRKGQPEYVNLSDLMGFTPTAAPGTPRTVARAPIHLAKFLIGSIVIGLAVATMLLPLVLPPAVGVRQAALWWQNLPSDIPVDEALPRRSVMYAADGKTKIATFYSENRVPLASDQMPDSVKAALVATEDVRFYEHNGIDPRGLARALMNNSSGGDRQGGSTITQQYVKNILLANAKTPEEQAAVTAITPARKIAEMRYAVALEQKLTKDEIITGYLNTVYFGNGAYGIAAAARRYFSVAPKDLTIAQAATLIGLLKSPTNYDPIKYPEASIERRDTVLDRMLTAGYITEQQYEDALIEALILNPSLPQNGCDTSPWPFYCQWVKNIIAEDPAFGATPEARQELLYKGGLSIVTAMEPEAMDIAQKAVDKALTPKNRVTAAIAVVEPGTGLVPAIATSKKWGLKTKQGETQIITPVVPAYQPGSTFKPIVLATALEQGFPISTRFDTPNNYKPAKLNHPDDGFSNDDDRGHGVIDAYRATADSVNTWYVQLIERTGVLPVADMAARLGLTSIPREGDRRISSKDAATALGVWETSPLQMASVYATFAAQGVACNPIAIISATQNGVPIKVPSADCRQAISPAVANTVTDVLQAPLIDGTASRLRLDDDRPAAGKTGTTNGSGATWFAGFTPQYAASVWIGDLRGPKYGLRGVTAYNTYFSTVYGGSIAGPIWNDTMNDLLKGQPIEEFPGASALAQAGIGLSVPDVRGLPRDMAITTLIDAGYNVEVLPETGKPDDLLPPGYVVAQSPKPGTGFGPETVVSLRLSAGSDVNVTIPSAQPVYNSSLTPNELTYDESSRVR